MRVGGAVLLALFSVSWLFWIVWAYVPTQLEVFATFGIPLTGPARLVVAAANTFVRLLGPVIVLGVAIGFVGFRRVANAVQDSSAAKPVFTGAIVLALSAIAASAFVVWGLHTSADASEMGIWNEAVRRLDACGAEQPSEEP